MWWRTSRTSEWALSLAAPEPCPGAPGGGVRQKEEGALFSKTTPSDGNGTHIRGMRWNQIDTEVKKKKKMSRGLWSRMLGSEEGRTGVNEVMTV